MKISLALGNREALTPQTARGCAGMNLALPGFGSIMAGRAVGYIQAALTVIGFGLTMLFGVKFVLWYLDHWAALNSPEADPIESLMRVGHEVRWAVLGIALFAADWLWALGTNAFILRAVRKKEDGGKPPRLT